MSVAFAAILTARMPVFMPFMIANCERSGGKEIRTWLFPVGDLSLAPLLCPISEALYDLKTMSESQ
jgi:hypothetical protein